MIPRYHLLELCVKLIDSCLGLSVFCHNVILSLENGRVFTVVYVCGGFSDDYFTELIKSAKACTWVVAGQLK